MKPMEGLQWRKVNLGPRKKLKSEVEYSGNNSNEAKENGLPLQKVNLGPRKKLLILGLGGLLCHRVYRHDKSSIPNFRRPDAAYGSFYVYKRPYCEAFMKFCLERFEVGIWSSAMERYMDSTLDCVMKGLRRKLVFAWDQAECTDSGFNSLEKRNMPILLKELKKIWENKSSNSKATLPSWIVQYSSTNTLLITPPYKALLNPPHTSICPAEYTVDQVDDMALGPKGELRLYLEGLADEDDVTCYVKEHPIGKPAITSAHADWDFYSKIISRFQKD